MDSHAPNSKLFFIEKLVTAGDIGIYSPRMHILRCIVLCLPLDLR